YLSYNENTISYINHFKDNIRFYAPIIIPDGAKYKIVDGHHRFDALYDKYKLYMSKKKKIIKTRKVKNKDKYLTSEVERTYNVLKEIKMDKIWVIKPKDISVQLT
ncbi:MAG: hypothetical protein AABY22_03260, partial [Nanoarchaeota archaeon]